jgi:hypothetical protein
LPWRGGQSSFSHIICTVQINHLVVDLSHERPLMREPTTRSSCQLNWNLEVKSPNIAFKCFCITNSIGGFQGRG